MSCNDNYQITFNNTGEFSPESAKALAKDLAGLAALSVLRRGVADPGFIKRVGKDQDTIRALEVENTDLRRQLVNALERNRAAECSAKFAEMKALGITPEFPGKQTSKLEGARDDWAPESREVAMAEQWGEEFERQ